MNPYIHKNIAPMLLKEERSAFNSPNYLFEIKFDGSRTLAYIEKNKTTLVNKRFKDVTNTFPELSQLHQQFRHKVILDGEVVIFQNERPDFFLLQTRSLLTNPYKIELRSKENPATFVVFDILYYEDKSLISLPLIERKKYLKDLFTPNNKIIQSLWLLNDGIKLFEFAKEKNLEGVIAKEKNSLYYPGVRNAVWLKLKILEEEDLVIAGYIIKENGSYDLILARITDLKPTYAAKVNTSGERLKRLKIRIVKKPHFPYPKEVTWIKLYYIATVKFMMKTSKGGLRQAVLKTIRDDKIIDDLQ